MEKHWKKFLTDLYKFLSSYEIQSERELYNVRNLSDWGYKNKPQGILIYDNFEEFLTILETYGVDTKNVKMKKYKPHLYLINDMLLATLHHNPQVFCTDGTLIIQGDVITMGQISLRHACKTNINKVKFFASNTIYLDADWNFFTPNFSLALMAPTIEVRNWKNLGFGDDSSRFLVVGGLVNRDKLTIHNGQTRILNFNGSPSNAQNLGQDEIDTVQEFKVFLRNSLKRVEVISKEQIKVFLKNFNKHPEIFRTLNFDGLLAEYVSLEEQFKTYLEQHIELFPFYLDLLKVIAQKAAIEAYTKDEKIVLYHIYTSLLTKLNLLEENLLSTKIVTQVKNDLNRKAREYKSLKENGVKNLISELQKLQKIAIDIMIEDEQRFIRRYILLGDSARRNTTIEQNLQKRFAQVADDILYAIAKLLDQLGNLGLHVNQIIFKTNQISENLAIAEISEIEIPFEVEFVKDLIGKIKVEELSTDMTEFKDIDGADELEAYSRSIRADVVALVSQVAVDIDHLEKKMSTTSFASLDVVKWKILNFLRRVKGYVKKLPKSTTSNNLEDVVNTFINIYQRIESLSWQKKIANFVQPLHNSNWEKELEKKSLSKIVKDTKETIFSNLVLAKYENHVNSVKHYTFPYFNDIASRYKLNPDLLKKSNASALLDDCKNKIESLVKYLFETPKPTDAGQIRTKSYNYKNPLAIWDHSTYKTELAKLFSGEKIFLKADIRLNPPLKNAIRFTNIEIHFKATNETYQKSIDNLLDYFDIDLTHSGNSYYRCDNKTYLITTRKSSMYYSHEVVDEERRIRNGVYTEIRDGDGILSPYTTWKLNLYEPDSGKTFDDLRNLSNLVDLHLVAFQRYFTKDSNICNRNIDDYYDFEEPFPVSARRKRYATSTASTISSPFNNLFGSMNAAISRISYFGGFATKSIGVVQENYIPPTAFFDQVNSLLILAPVLIILGKSCITKSLTPSKYKIQNSQLKIWTSIIEDFRKLLTKYDLQKTWLALALEDKKEDVTLVLSDQHSTDFENDLVMILIDFLDDIQYDPLFEKVKTQENFIFDVNLLIESLAKITNFERRLQHCSLCS